MKMMHDKKSKMMAAGGSMMKKGYSAGSGLKMVEKDGQRVPFYAADGKGKMAAGGATKAKMMAAGGATKAKMMAAGGATKAKMMAAGGATKTKATMQRIAAKKVKGHESRMHKGKK